VFPAPTPVEIPEDLTADKTLEILKEMVDGMEKAMASMLAHARAEGINDVQKAMDEFQGLYVEHVEQMTQAQMKAHGISQQVLLCCHLWWCRQGWLSDYAINSLITRCRFSRLLCRSTTARVSSSGSRWSRFTLSKRRRT
jgi:hypothetical protein